MATAQELATELAHVRAQIVQLRLREQDLVDSLAAEMTEKALFIAGVGSFERHRKADRKQWKHDELRSALLVAAKDSTPQVDAKTGEIEGDWERAFRVMGECARPEWRVRALRVYDLNADEFAEVTYGGYSIQITS